MTADPIYSGLIYNVALLLAMLVVSSQFIPRKSDQGVVPQLLCGATLAVIVLVIMGTPWQFSPGIIFDTRSILLSVSGLFFGTIPTLIAASAAAIYRYTLGGAAFTGILVILATSTIGLAWRYLRRDQLAKLGFFELLMFGSVCHIAMLALMFTLPGGSGIVVLKKITLPILAIYPLATALLSSLFVARLYQVSISDQLKQSQARLTSIFDHAPIGLWEQDWSKVKKQLDSRPFQSYQQHLQDFQSNPELTRSLAQQVEVLAVNQAAVTQSGTSQTETLLGPLEQAVNGLDPEHFAIELANLASGNLHFSYYRPHAIAEDKDRIMSVRVAVVPGHEQDLSNVIVTTLDVTEQLKNEESLQLAQSVYEHSNEGLIVTDENHQIIHVNSAFSSITGYSAQEALGRSPSLLSSGKHSEKFFQKMWQQLALEGFWQGEIWNRRKNGELYVEWLTIKQLENPNSRIKRYIGLFTDISHKKAAEEKIWAQANFDPVTNLPNRKMFCDSLLLDLNQSRDSNTSIALLCIDIDRFKEINDIFGHDAGDGLIIAVADRLTQIIPSADTLARLDGDEFGISICNVSNPRSLDHVAQKILDTLSTPFQIAGQQITISVSIGIALSPADGQTVSELFKHADQALVSAKQLGRGCYQYFIPSMQKLSEHRSQMEKALRQAIDNQEFELFYQPIVDLASGRVTKAEALIRWRHPERGLLMPSQFIQYAEDSGMIYPIGDWVFKQAATQASHWYQQSGQLIQLSINKSPMQFNAPASLLEEWLTYLQTLELPRNSMVVEITESLMIDTSEQIKAKVAELRRGGIKIALDDFGTGYSSLSYLKHLEADYIKIDQSFVRGISNYSNDKVLCEAVIMIAHKLGMKVVAEGIESDQQRSILNLAGCDYGQGFFFSKPLPAKQFAEKYLNNPQVSLADLVGDQSGSGADSGVLG